MERKILKIYFLMPIHLYCILEIDNRTSRSKACSRTPRLKKNLQLQSNPQHQNNPSMVLLINFCIFNQYIHCVGICHQAKNYFITVIMIFLSYLVHVRIDNLKYAALQNDGNSGACHLLATSGTSTVTTCNLGN